MATKVPLQSVVLSSPSSSVTFSNIDQSYMDLELVIQAKSTTAAQSWDIAYIQVGNNAIDTSASYSWTRLRGDGSSAASTRASGTTAWSLPAAGTDSLGTTCGELIIFNYSNTTTYKSSLGKQTNTNSDVIRYSNLWSKTSAINTISIYSYTGATWAAGSTFDLYGVSPVNAKVASASGGTDIFYDSTYAYHVFKGSGTFTPTRALSADILVVAGGGGGGYYSGGGGGAGGLQFFTSQSLAASTIYTIVVGAGGSSAPIVGAGASGTQGGNSQFSSLTASVGGGYGFGNNGAKGAGGNGGSGGGAGGVSGSTNGGSPTSGQGYAGGNSSFTYAGAGGGGAGGVAPNATLGSTDGGIGATSATLTAIGLATGTGQLSGGNYYYAGGGAGNGEGGNKTGGLGGGGNTATSGKTNTGGGGGGDVANGGSGIVIVRYVR